MPILIFLGELALEFLAWCRAAKTTQAVYQYGVAMIGILRGIMATQTAPAQLMLELRAFGTFAFRLQGSNFFITFAAQNGRTTQQIINRTFSHRDMMAFLIRCIKLFYPATPRQVPHWYTIAQQMVRNYPGLSL